MDEFEGELDVNRPVLMASPALEEDLSIPPMTGEQYLRRVIEEAKTLDLVTIADTSKVSLRTENTYPDFPALKECGKDLLPSKDWQLSAMADFSQLRLDMEKLREKLPPSKLFQLNKSLSYRDEEEALRKICKQNEQKPLKNPSTEFCLALSQRKLCGLLNYFGEWLTNGVISIDVGCRWAYCLLACLQLPAESGVYFYLRQIARALINSRALLESYESDDLPRMNLLICIIGRYFNQTDLADPFLEVQD